MVCKCINYNKENDNSSQGMAKIIFHLKPNKPANNPLSCRLISHLSTTYKVFENLLLASFQQIIENELPVVQVGFRTNKSYCDQVLTLTTHNKNEFQRKEKA